MGQEEGRQQLLTTHDAGLRFGQGRRKAALNFDDCFAYALAITEDVPRLYTHKDFAQTDVAAA